MLLVTAVDDYTVEFKFNEPFAPFMTLVSQVRWRVDPPEAEEEFGDLRDAQSQIGTGPWMSATYEPNIKISMVRNDEYWRGPNGQTGEVLPLAKKVYAIIIEDEAAAMAAYRSGLQDHGPAWRCWGWWSALDDHLVALSDRPDLVYHYHSTGGGMYANYFYGPKLEGIWKNRNMRYAVAMFNDISCAAWCAVTGGIQDTRYVAVDNPWFLPNEELTPDGQQFYLNFPEPTMDLEKAQGFLMTAKEELGLPLDKPVKITLTIRGSATSLLSTSAVGTSRTSTRSASDSELVVLDSADRLKLVKGEFEHLGLMYNSGWQDADSLFYNRYHSDVRQQLHGRGRPRVGRPDHAGPGRVRPGRSASRSTMSCRSSRRRTAVRLRRSELDEHEHVPRVDAQPRTADQRERVRGHLPAHVDQHGPPLPTRIFVGVTVQPRL